MSIEKEFFEFIKQSSEFQGKVLSSLENLNSYVGAVNTNVKELRDKHDNHVIDLNAHGKTIEDKKNGVLMQWIALAVSVIAIGAAFYKK